MNAEFIAPSANKLLNKFGNLKAIKNASDNIPAPKTLAFMMSLKKPRILLINVNELNIENDFKNDTNFLVI